VLIVDDDPDIRTVMHLALAAEGYAVAEAADGGEALALLDERRPSLVLLDLNLPKLTGWDVHARLRENNVEVPVVFMTAGTDACVQAARHRADGCLPKPFALDELLRIVRRFAA
jgi:DNA-binding response OmpR family regulator